MPDPNFKIATLVFLENEKGEQLLIHRKQSPNNGLWIPIGGKLDVSSGESPVECAVREVKEEANFEITAHDLHLFGYLSERNYEASGNWLIFLFHCNRTIHTLPPAISEGSFGFYSLETIPDLPIPHSDKTILWPLYTKKRTVFTGIQITYTSADSYRTTIEQELSF